MTLSGKAVTRQIAAVFGGSGGGGGGGGSGGGGGGGGGVCVKIILFSDTKLYSVLQQLPSFEGGTNECEPLLSSWMIRTKTRS